ncbi:head completion/stabilization protein [Burkholderia multivorans]|uniref:head completion/stabilization protein n=1 Tax=Burkholderia multivorans TaxID=87883 RepID=UPI000CFE4BAB|nr:head completion/stabilization protein [Burkholderia multivorans]MBU9261728.1 head completion/stabilization protein [Burkholderia multivorans]MBU9490283.1 head completion/stabilization protein [Burkholderia multivorans]MBU9662672.1 head completion/stabilization protein [Burkholderia multivorans]MCA8261862.1 head completion/stabilization protein [Burkholderia multivorans]MCO1383306.1 head completion/stabilization protein [Burkholderia multivorans]
MSFVSTPPLAQPPQTAAPPIANDAFYPDVSLEHARDTMRLDGSVTDARLRHELLAAIASVNDELRTARTAWRDAGFARLADVPADQLDGESVLLQHYRRAVYCLAKATLIERYRDYDTTGDGARRADDLEPQSDELRRDARWAISDIVGRPRVTVELI